MSEVNLTREELYTFPKMLHFNRMHPVLAVRDIMGILLTPHQRIDLRLMWFSACTEFLRLFSRGMSKSFGLAIYALLNAVLYPGLNILVLGGGGFRQGKMVLEKCSDIINCQNIDGQVESWFLKSMIDVSGKRSSSLIRKDADKWYIPFKNGSQVFTVPIGPEGEGILGYRTHINAVDERRSMKGEIFERVVKKFSIVAYNVVSDKQDFINRNIQTGTLDTIENDYTQEYLEFRNHIQQYMEGQISECPYMVTQFIYPDAFNIAAPEEKYDKQSKFFGCNLKYWSTRYNILVKGIEEELEKATTDLETWLAEYVSIPMRGTGDYYPYKLINDISHRKVMSDAEYMKMTEQGGADIFQYIKVQYRCPDPVIIGVDVARESDWTAFVVVRVGQKAEGNFDPVEQLGYTRYSNVIWAYQQEHMHDPEAALYIYRLLERYPNAIMVKMDKRGGGSGVRDQLFHVVNDGKAKAALGYDPEILYDPNDNDEGGIVELLRKEGVDSENRRLGLVTYGDMENTIANRNVRGAMRQNQFYFPNPEEKFTGGLDDDEKQAYDFVRVMGQQFRWIKTKPTANWSKFETKDPRKQKKDLYSACIYAFDEVYNRVYKSSDKREQRKVHNIATTLSVGRRL